MSKKQPNQLAKLIDHQAFAGSALPQALANDMQLYTQMTHELKTLLIDCLPEEILAHCWVVGLNSEQLTLSVGSATAANHIRYLQSAYLQVLTEQSLTFKQLKKIRVIVSKGSSDNSLYEQKLSSKMKDLNYYKIGKNQALSQNTKRTIAQAAEHVTTDKNLKKALLRLINE
ncbi:DciA family protein [uncultured Psychrobacter sp.]|uniref:DciA family protein n=1 Tax=uncultured Psychrobacter sp. TaxID=259303 RepID=UPI00262CD3C5|nr:DciA family protein [uncultured Psychrobacter sp.]